MFKNVLINNIINKYTMMCIFIDNSKVDFVLFESVGTLRDALIRDWCLLSQDQKNEIRQYLLQFTIIDDNIAPFVRDRILQVIIILSKLILKLHNLVLFYIILIIYNRLLQL